VSRSVESRHDPALRADVRLLGEILGRVLLEQEGAGAFALEERIRHLAQRGRRGDAEASAELATLIGGLPVATQATMLRAFAARAASSSIGTRSCSARSRSGTRTSIR